MNAREDGVAADVRATHTQSVVHHDALQDPKCELWPALVHDDAGYDEVHALAVADILVVQAVSARDVTFFLWGKRGANARSIDEQQHLLALP